MISLERYPKEITLRDGAKLLLRPLTREDAAGLWDFLRRLPEIDKAHFHEDVDDFEVVRRWADTIDYETSLPVLAWDGNRVVGSVTLYRNHTGWKQRIGIVRILIAPDFRRLGLGIAMIREMRHLAEKAVLNYLVVEVVEEQQSAVRALERMGFEKKVVHPKYVNDRKGRLYDLAVLVYSLSEGGGDPYF